MSTAKLQGDIKVINQRLDTIENNHLTHLREDIKSKNMGDSCISYRPIMFISFNFRIAHDLR